MTDDERAASIGTRARLEFEQTENAFAAVRNAILQEIVNTSPSQPDKVLKLHMTIQNLTAVRMAIVEVINNGLAAEQAISVAGLTRN